MIVVDKIKKSKGVKMKAQKQNKIKVEMRTIAKMLASAQRIEDEEFAKAVESYLLELHQLPENQKLALGLAYIFSRKVPAQEREDLYQELVLKLLEGDACRQGEKLAYSVARCDWIDWWQRYKLHSQYNDKSLNALIEDDQGNSIELGDLIAGEVEFEAKTCLALDCESLWESLPGKVEYNSYKECAEDGATRLKRTGIKGTGIKYLVAKRLAGRALSGVERVQLNRYAHAHTGNLC